MMNIDQLSNQETAHKARFSRNELLILLALTRVSHLISVFLYRTGYCTDFRGPIFYRQPQKI